MKRFTIIKTTSYWSAGALANRVETLINGKSNEGYDIVNVSFGTNIFYLPTAFITPSH